MKVRRALCLLLLGGFEICNFGCGRAPGNVTPAGAVPEIIRGTDLHLMSVAAPFSIYTNDGTREFAIFDQGELLVYRRREAGALATDFCRKGLTLFSFNETPEGGLTNVACTFYSQGGKPTITYINKDGNGEWDKMVDMGSGRALVREGNCWVDANARRKTK